MRPDIQMAEEPVPDSLWRDGTTHPVMSPLEFMQMLAALALQQRPHPFTAAFGL